MTRLKYDKASSACQLELEQGYDRAWQDRSLEVSTLVWYTSQKLLILMGGWLGGWIKLKKVLPKLAKPGLGQSMAIPIYPLFVKKMVL